MAAGPHKQVQPRRSDPWRVHVTCALVAVLLWMGAVIATADPDRSSKASQGFAPLVTHAAVGMGLATVAATEQPRTLEELLLLPAEELALVDLALINLLCAEGLPGSEALDIEKVLRTIEQWTDRVRLETIAYEHRFRRNPSEHYGSEADFRMLTLITVVQRDLGVAYNLERANEPDFRSSKDLFIHGFIHDDNGGTCASMPILYATIARRLGYPVRLVQAKGHLFTRWDDPDGERLNIDGSGFGMNTFDDTFYMEWPSRITELEVAREYYLKSLTSEEDLAVCLANRGHCLLDNGRIDEALDVYREAAKRLPTPDYQQFVAHAEHAMAARVSKSDATESVPIGIENK